MTMTVEAALPWLLLRDDDEEEEDRRKYESMRRMATR